MNLAVHGLGGDIRQGNAYYEDLHASQGKFDFVMANPPFNVDRVDKERLKDDSRFPFGTPHSDNANYLWIQAFYSALNSTGRAGFVMHNSAADAEIEIRKRLVKENVVDAVLLTSANLFYTVSLPCSLWFLDRDRESSERSEHVLFIDARHMFRPIDTAHREIAPEQIDEIASVVRSYRSEGGAAPYRDVEGFCKRISREEITAHKYTLNPKVYVEHSSSATTHLSKALSLSERFNELAQEATRLSSAISSDITNVIPPDRGLLLQAARLLFKKWFVNLDAATSDVAADAGLPKGWTRKPYREVVSRYIGGGWGKEEPEGDFNAQVRIIRGTDMARVRIGEVDSCPVRYIKPRQLESRELSPGDVVIEVSGGGKDTSTGRTTVISQALIDSSPQPLICASFCKLMRFDESTLLPSVAYLNLQHIYDDRVMEKYEVQSTGIKNFKFELFLDKAEIVVPPMPLQQEFDAVAADMLDLTHVLGVMCSVASELAEVVPAHSEELFGLATLNIRRPE